MKTMTKVDGIITGGCIVYLGVLTYQFVKDWREMQIERDNITYEKRLLESMKKVVKKTLEDK